MKSFLGKRAVTSAISLVGLIILVFFLSRLTGDPTDLYLPENATQEARDNFRAIHGLDQPLIVQFGKYVGDMARMDFGMSIRRAEPAITAVIVFGSMAAFRVGGIFDRIATFFSLIGASAPDFWIAIVLFSVTLGWVPTSGTGQSGTGSCRSVFCSSGPSG